MEHRYNEAYAGLLAAELLGLLALCDDEATFYVQVRVRVRVRIRVRVRVRVRIRVRLGT